ncbi:MAG: hypothetical protein L3J12_08430, partial [Spirochaetales bacterium]|nr:hypothetical protein [Spirochaetales bacterium]
LGDDPDSILGNPLFLSGDRESFGIVALSETEYIQWFLGNTEVSGLFTAVVDGNSETFYVLADTITEPEKVLFETACRKYLRDGILFPYYEYNAGRGEYTLLEGLGAEELDTVSSLFSGLGLSVFTSLNRSFTYFSNALLPVSYTGIDSVGNVNNDFPSGTVPAIHRNPGSVEIPYFDNSGRSSFFTAYIHNYNSEFDYSSENLVNYPEEIYNDDTLVGTDLALNTPEDRIPESFELFSGGTAGWFYGTWIGYYGDFDSTMLHALPPGAAEGEVILPKYFTSMIRNTKIDGSSGPEVPEVGKDLLLVIDDNAMTGDVSSYTESDFDENGEPVSKSYSFTSVISGNILHADRNGGDTYFNIPRGSSSITGSRIGLVSESKSESKDLNGGVDAGVFSLSFSRNRGSSWQYRNLMDMNGDRYPDIVSYTSSEGGSNSFSVIAGNGQGFSDKVNYTSPVNNLSHSTNVSYGFGASSGSGNGAISQILSAAGVVKATTVDTPDKSSGVGIGFSGLNGTAGASYRTEGFLDVTGDGLPDHLKRDAGGEYFVAVNRGDNSFAPLVSYGSGINTTLYDTPGNAADLGTEALGLDFTNSGSLGTGGSISIPGVGIIQGAGISVGFNASSNRTLSRLIDINSDGLADQVVKKPNESFFRVRFNLGDSFSEAETAIYRPEWNTSFADTKGLLQSLLGESASVFDSMDIPMVNAVPGVTTLPDAGANPFISIINPLGVDDAISYTGGISINLGASLTMVYGINLGVARFGFEMYIVQVAMTEVFKKSSSTCQKKEH